MKKYISLILALVLCFSLASGIVAHADCTQDDMTHVLSTSDSHAPTRAEETEWVMRITDDGLVQVRLWSITYGYWKTDWITIGHV